MDSRKPDLIIRIRMKLIELGFEEFKNKSEYKELNTVIVDNISEYILNDKNFGFTDDQTLKLLHKIITNIQNWTSTNIIDKLGEDEYKKIDNIKSKIKEIDEQMIFLKLKDLFIGHLSDILNLPNELKEQNLEYIKKELSREIEELIEWYKKDSEEYLLNDEHLSVYEIPHYQEEGLNKSLTTITELLKKSKPTTSLEGNIIGSTFNKTDISDDSKQRIKKNVKENKKNGSSNLDLKDELSDTISTIKSNKDRQIILKRIEDNKLKESLSQYDRFNNSELLNIRIPHVLNQLKNKVEKKLKNNYL